MKTLVKHLVDENMKEILEKSYRDCHCTGLHSIMLLESPGKTIRLYITDTNHEMWKNHLDVYEREKLSVAFHDHHCNLTLHCIKGSLTNWSIWHKKTGNIIALKPYTYQSAIIKGQGKIFPIKDPSTCLFNHGVLNTLKPGMSLPLHATDIHTVYIKRRQEAAWLVYEGEENRHYSSILYTNNDPANMINPKHYQRFNSAKEIKLLLTKVGLL